MAVVGAVATAMAMGMRVVVAAVSTLVGAGVATAATDRHLTCPPRRGRGDPRHRGDGGHHHLGSSTVRVGHSTLWLAGGGTTLGGARRLLAAVDLARERSGRTLIWTRRSKR